VVIPYSRLPIPKREACVGLSFLGPCQFHEALNHGWRFNYRGGHFEKLLACRLSKGNSPRVDMRPISTVTGRATGRSKTIDRHRHHDAES